MNSNSSEIHVLWLLSHIVTNPIKNEGASVDKVFPIVILCKLSFAMETIVPILPALPEDQWSCKRLPDLGSLTCRGANDPCNGCGIMDPR